MPTYQYSCTECGHFFEQFQSFSEESLTVCPQCEGRLRKVFNAVGVVFKGSGFYRTDSRGADKSSDTVSSGASAGSGSSSDTGGGSSTGTTGTAGSSSSGSTSGSSSGSTSGSGASGTSAA